MTVHVNLDLERGVREAHPIGETVYFSRPRPGRVDANEDALLVHARDDALVVAVADGAGGCAGGDLAAAAAVESLAAELEGQGDRALREAVLAGFEEANRRVLALGVGAATTLVVAVIKDGGVRSYHVGDSLLLLVGQRGKRKLETIAHSPVGYAVEAGVLSEDEALHHEERHLVSNMVGTPEMRVEMSARVPLRPRDTLLLASDGVSDNLLMDEVVETIRKGPLESVAAELAALGAARMKAPRENQPSKLDDLTFVLFRPVTPPSPRRG